MGFILTVSPQTRQRGWLRFGGRIEVARELLAKGRQGIRIRERSKFWKLEHKVAERPSRERTINWSPPYLMVAKRFSQPNGNSVICSGQSKFQVNNKSLQANLSKRNYHRIQDEEFRRDWNFGMGKILEMQAIFCRLYFSLYICYILSIYLLARSL